MAIRTITPEYSVSPQIEASDVAAIAEQGYRSIMCNRPDGEELGQTPAEDIRREADRLGLPFVFIPVISGRIDDGNVADFRAALAALPTPVLAYCRSGARCQNLWALVQD